MRASTRRALVVPKAQILGSAYPARVCLPPAHRHFLHLPLSHVPVLAYVPSNTLAPYTRVTLPQFKMLFSTVVLALFIGLALFPALASLFGSIIPAKTKAADSVGVPAAYPSSQRGTHTGLDPDATPT